jgi:hypothetical protein
MYISATRLVAPMMLVGFTALSVEIITNALDAELPPPSARFASRDVVLDGLARVLLHQRHVLVRRRVEDDLRLHCANTAAPRSRRHVADDRLEAIIAAQRLSSCWIVEEAFSSVERASARAGRVARSAAHLRPDRAAGAGHEDVRPL